MGIIQSLSQALYGLNLQRAGNEVKWPFLASVLAKSPDEKLWPYNNTLTKWYNTKGLFFRFNEYSSRPVALTEKIGRDPEKGKMLQESMESHLY